MAREEILSQVRSHIEQAAELLRSLGADYEQAAWLVEDSAFFLNETAASPAEKAELAAATAGKVRWQDFSYDSDVEEHLPRNGTRD